MEATKNRTRLRMGAMGSIPRPIMFVGLHRLVPASMVLLLVRTRTTESLSSSTVRLDTSPSRLITRSFIILFQLVKAMYDYKATIDEEFDFTNGDVIAVTSTPEDGWWTGMLLDDTRRVPGRSVFPSNFVCLF